MFRFGVLLRIFILMHGGCITELNERGAQVKKKIGSNNKCQSRFCL